MQMPDAALEFLRQTLLDRALAIRDFERARALTSDGWESRVVQPEPDAFSFLEEHEYFYEKRLWDDLCRQTVLNYRYQCEQDGVRCIGEIRIPLRGQTAVVSEFRAKRLKLQNAVSEPEWFTRLVRRARIILARGPV